MGRGRAIISRNLRVLRHARGLSQEDLAEAAGVHRTYVGLLERDKTSASVDKLESLAEALRVETWELLHPETAERFRGEK